jgi:signal recognition particle subunit SRP54
MIFEKLSLALSESFKKITKQDRISEKHLSVLLEDVREALIEGDVSVSVMDRFLADIHDDALNQKVLTQLKPSEALMKIVYDRMVELLGPQQAELKLSKKPSVVLMVGLQGSGKTTSVAKLAKHLRTKLNKKVLVVAADLQRPAAIDQLEILALAAQAECYSDRSTRDVLSVVKAGLARGRALGVDVIIVDTAGRLAIDQALMDELVAIKKLTQPDEILLSVDAMTGQDVIRSAQGFHERLDVNGLVVTKFDSSAKGGAVFSVKQITQVPIKFVGTGEKIDDYDAFYPDRMANRVIGMGDLLSLVEQAESKLDKADAERSFKRMMEGQFTLEDMLDQFNQLSKMGSLSSLMKMIPGANQMAQNINDEASNAAIKQSKAIIQSMTYEERDDPSILRASRKARIAKGSGTSVTDVNRLINQYEKAKEQMRMLKRLGKNLPLS